MVRYVSETYLADVEKYELKMFFDSYEDIIVCVKKIIKIKKPFILNEDGHMIKILDDNYYILEVIPLQENYIVRVHLDEKGNVIERFYTMTAKNELREGIPSYDDLKLSYVCTSFCKKIYNKEKFDKLLEDGLISKETHKQILKQFKTIKNSIDCRDNKILNLNYKKYLF